MKKSTRWMASLLIILAVAGCATCKSTDTVEQCRTKQRDNGQRRVELPSAAALKTAAA